jgi:hypothetical protein
MFPIFQEIIIVAAEGGIFSRISFPFSNDQFFFDLVGGLLHFFFYGVKENSCSGRYNEQPV